MNLIRLNVKGTTICTRTYFKPFKVFVATNRWGLRITQTRILASYIKGDFIEETQLQGLPSYTI